MDEVWFGLVGVLLGAVTSTGGTMIVEWLRTSRAAQREDTLGLRSHLEALLGALLDDLSVETRESGVALLAAVARLDMRLPGERNGIAMYGSAVGTLLRASKEEGMVELAKFAATCPEWVRGKVGEEELQARMERIQRRVAELRAAPDPVT